jgi:hypothetical protein
MSWHTPLPSASASAAVVLAAVAPGVYSIAAETAAESRCARLQVDERLHQLAVAAEDAGGVGRLDDPLDEHLDPRDRSLDGHGVDRVSRAVGEAGAEERVLRRDRPGAHLLAAVRDRRQAVALGDEAHRCVELVDGGVPDRKSHHWTPKR